MMFTKSKLIKYLDKRALELSDTIDLSEYGSDETKRLQEELDRTLRMRDALKEPKIPKEVWVEILKGLGLAAALALVIAYDANDHVLPKGLERWIPTPKL